MVSPSFPATAPSTDHSSLSLASPCFRDVPTICEPETDNRYTGKINPRIKSFFHLRPPLFILSLAGGKLTALIQGQIWLAGPVYWKWIQSKNQSLPCILFRNRLVWLDRSWLIVKFSPLLEWPGRPFLTNGKHPKQLNLSVLSKASVSASLRDAHLC